MKKVINMLVLVCISISLVFSTTGCGSSGDKSAPKDSGNQATDQNGKMTIRVSHVLDVNSPWHQTAEVFKEEVEEKTNGTIQVQVFPSGQLGGERQVAESLRNGLVEASIITNGTYGNFDPYFLLFDLPYSFESLDQAQKVMAGPLGDEYKKKISNLGIVFLGWVEGGFRNVFANKPVQTTDDMKGMKIRTMENKTYIETFKAFSASPVPMAFTELYSALQQGIVDGAETSPVGYLTQRFYEVSKFYSLNEYSYNPTALVISKKFFDKLSKEQQQIVIDAGNKAEQYANEAYHRETKAALEFVQKNGATVVEVKDKSSFINAIKPIWPQLLSSVPNNQELIKKLEDAKVQAGK